MAASSKRFRVELGRRISEIATLRWRDTEDAVPWGRPSLGASVLILAADPYGEELRRYLDEVEPARQRFERLGGRFLLVVSGDVAIRDEGADPIDVPIVRDSNDTLRAGCGLEPGESALLVTDRWGEIYDVFTPASGHDWPDAEELQEWLYYLAMQCPECGVPDHAGSDWSHTV